MRPKILLAVLAVVGLALGTAFLWKLPAPAPVSETSPVQKTAGATPPEINAAGREQPAAVAANPVPPPPAVATNKPAPAYASEAEHQAAINAETERLSSLAMNSDPQSLSNILADLNSPDKEVRMAAIEAAKQFENTNAIPALRAAAMNAAPDEAIAMLEAAQWLATPTADLSTTGPGKSALTPAQAQDISADEAKVAIRKQANLQTKAINQSLQGTVPGQAHNGSGQSPTTPTSGSTGPSGNAGSTGSGQQ